MYDPMTQEADMQNGMHPVYLSWVITTVVIPAPGWA
jgi:hypothetical protein